MTKKSAARLARDAAASQNQDELSKFFKINTAWDDLQDVYVSVATLIAESYAAVLGVYNDPVVLSNLGAEKYGETQNLLRGLASDVDVFVKDLTHIRSTHADKKGGSTSVEDFQMTVSTFEEYEAIRNRWEGVTGRTIQNLMADAAEAAARAADILKAATTIPAAQDITVVTDVEVKTPIETLEKATQ